MKKNPGKITGLYFFFNGAFDVLHICLRFLKNQTNVKEIKKPKDRNDKNKITEKIYGKKVSY